MTDRFQYRDQFSLDSPTQSVFICEICVPFVSAYKRWNGTQMEWGVAKNQTLPVVDRAIAYWFCSLSAD
jgi:hypothetical protein